MQLYRFCWKKRFRQFIRRQWRFNSKPPSCDNSKTSHIVDMKLGTVTKVDKENTATSKKLTMPSCCQIITSSSFSNWWPICSQILDAWPKKVTFSLKVTYYLIVIANWTKTYHSSYTIALSKDTIFTKKCWFFATKMLPLAKLLRR